MSAYIASIGKRALRDAANDAAELCRLANSLTRLNEIACNFSPEDQTKDKQNLAALATETLVFLYFAVTMLQLFSIIDERLWLVGEDQGLFGQLESVRREIATNPAVAAANLASIRSAFGLPSRPRGPLQFLVTPQ